MGNKRKSTQESERSGDELFGWVADFEAPAVAQMVERPAPRRTLVPAIIGASVFLIAGAVALGAFLRPFDGVPGETREAGPDVPPVSAPGPTADPDGDAPATDDGSIHPASCSELYGNDMRTTFDEAGLHLNEVWTGVRSAPAGTRDEVLLAALAAADTSVGCYWLDTAGGEKHAVLTSVVTVSPEQEPTIIARLAEIGQTQVADRHGVRYFSERRISGETVGESHYLRGGLWFATHWYGYGPFGYTNHMAEQVFS